MSEIRQLFKLLLKKEFYRKHETKIPVGAFDDIGQSLLDTVKEAHDKFNRDIITDELLLLYLSANPTLTTANKNTIEVYLDNIKAEQDIGADVATDVFKTMWRQEVGRRITNYGVGLVDGSNQDVDELSTFIDTVGSGIVPEDNLIPVDTSPVALFESLNRRGKWVLNIPTLNERIKHVSPGHFLIILARPESGKTAAIIHLLASREGFAAQGAKVHLLSNEEGADVTAGRAICCYNQQSFHAVRENPKIADTEGWAKIKNNLVFVHSPEMNFAQLDSYLKKYRPDFIVVDQLDNVSLNGAFNSSHERLGAVYRRARELASKYDCVFIGVTQASAEAEGATRVTFSHAEGSKTGKAAAADLIIGIGKSDEATDEEGNAVLRYFTVSKNKISGWHGTIIAKLLQDQSRFIA